MEIVRYRQFFKEDHEKILEYLNQLYEKNRYVDVIELDNTLIVFAPEEYDGDEREKRVEFIPFSEEAKIAERLNEKGVNHINVYRCTHGYLVIQYLDLEEEEDEQKDYTIPFFIVIVLVVLGILGGLLALLENADRWFFQ